MNIIKKLSKLNTKAIEHVILASENVGMHYKEGFTESSLDRAFTLLLEAEEILRDKIKINKKQVKAVLNKIFKRRDEYVFSSENELEREDEQDEYDNEEQPLLWELWELLPHINEDENKFFSYKRKKYIFCLEDSIDGQDDSDGWLVIDIC